MKPHLSLHRVAAPVLLLALGSAFTWGGCRSSALYSEAPIGDLGYVPGTPNFDLQIVPSWLDGEPGATVHFGIPPASLVFTPRGSVYRAAYDVILRVLDTDGDLLREAFDSHEAEAPDVEGTTSFRPYLHEERLTLDPGTYLIQAVLLDAASGRQATRQERIRVPEADEPFISAPLVSETASTGERRPLLNAYLPEHAATLEAAVSYRNLRPSTHGVSFAVWQMERDTSYATPPYWVGPGYGTLGYQGIDPSNGRLVYADTMRIEASGSGATRFALPVLSRGLYRMEVGPVGAEEENGVGTSRFFVVTDPAFPRVETLEQMVNALGYIAFEREIAQIREGATPAERRQRFDAFWGSLVDRRTVAANLLQTYFARIEEANLLFSGYKEGWKTDRGMVYVLLGAPVLVNVYTDSEIWRYTRSDDALYTFVFDRVKIQGSYGAYENYVLRRRPYYEHVWLQLLDRWRSGVVL